MRYQSTVFGQLLKAVPRGWFEREVGRHKSGRKKRALTEWGHLVAMVMAQMSGHRSLRDHERVVERHPGVLSHLDLCKVRRSTLSDANRDRPASLFEAVAAKLCGMLADRTGREGIRLIDATRIFAGAGVAAWARDAVKLHMSFDLHQERPVWFEVTSERVNDITAAKAMPIEPGMTYIFDKGYYDFSFWQKLSSASCRFVTRLKKNSPVTVLKQRKACGENILYDRIARLSERLCNSRRNPFTGSIRLIGVKIAGGREITLLTNDLKAPATKIAELYKARWQIELFFKWIKQNLKLAHFLGTSRNAVIIQIMAALIAFLLVRIATLRNSAHLGMQALMRLLPAMALERRSLRDLLSPPNQVAPQPIHTQIEIAYA
jgi:hypothetical protein